jgi:hypothetical protein
MTSGGYQQVGAQCYPKHSVTEHRATTVHVDVNSKCEAFPAERAAFHRVGKSEDCCIGWIQGVTGAGGWAQGTARGEMAARGGGANTV